MGGVLSAVIYGLPLEQVNSPFIINSGLRQSINPPWQFAYLLGQPVPPLQQMARGGCDSTVWPRKVLARFANMQCGGGTNFEGEFRILEKRMSCMYREVFESATQVEF